MSTLPALTWAVGTRVMNSNRPEKTLKNSQTAFYWGRSGGVADPRIWPNSRGSGRGDTAHQNKKAAKTAGFGISSGGFRRKLARKWSGAGSNRRHRPFQGRALPTELPDLGTLMLPL